MTTGDGLASVVKRHNRVHRLARRVRFALGHIVPPRRYAEIPGRVHFNDFMFTTTSAAEAASYAQRAQNVIALIEETLAVAGKEFDDVERWLDFGCGYGRVLRYLLQRVPAERVVVSDVVAEGAAFCHSEFGVTTVPSDVDLAEVRLGTYDFIYAISVVSHLDEANTTAFLQLLGNALAETGIVMFTTHGSWSLDHPGLYGPEYEAAAPALEATVRSRGMAYLPYAFATDGYGMTWHSREYVEGAVARLHEGRLAPLLFKPHGLDGHQDVYAFQRVSASL